MDYIFSNIKFFLLNEVDSLFIFDPLCKKKTLFIEFGKIILKFPVLED